MKRALFAGAAGCISFGLWLLYVSSLSPHELLAGTGAAALAAFASEAVRSAEQPRFVLHLRMLRAARRVPFEILRDCARVTAKLFSGRRPAGRFRTIPFYAGGDDGASVARRTLAIAFVTVSPNSIVIAIDKRRNRMLFHELVRGGAPQAAYLLGREARP